MPTRKPWLIYSGPMGIFGYAEYGFDGQEWWQRYCGFSRTGNPRRPEPWKSVSTVLAVRLAQAIDPDNPPKLAKIGSVTLLKGHR